MTLNEFRVLHSTLIEHYQHIEFNLKGLYSIMSGKSFLEGLNDVEKDSLGRIIKEIKKLKENEVLDVFISNGLQNIEDIVAKRNFWCHNCYIDLLFKLNGELKKSEDVKKLHNDLKEAEELRNKIFEIKSSLMKERII